MPKERVATVLCRKFPELQNINTTEPNSGHLGPLQWTLEKYKEDGSTSNKWYRAGPSRRAMTIPNFKAFTGDKYRTFMTAADRACAT